MASISSPKNSMRTASSSYIGMISTVSPRTRKVPRVKARSLRVYCICTNLRSRSSRWHLVADAERDHAVDVLLRRAEAVDAGHRGDDDDVAAGEQAVGGAVPQPLDLVVDRGVLLDVGVGLRDVGLGLEVVVVADEVLDGVVRQQLAELVGELGGERLVGRHDERRALHLLDEPGGRRRLAGAGGAEQHGVLLPRPDPAREVGDRRRLVAGGLEVGDDLEGRQAALELGGRTHAPTVCRATDTRSAHTRRDARSTRGPRGRSTRTEPGAGPSARTETPGRPARTSRPGSPNTLPGPRHCGAGLARRRKVRTVGGRFPSVLPAPPGCVARVHSGRGRRGRRRSGHGIPAGAARGGPGDPVEALSRRLVAGQARGRRARRGAPRAVRRRQGPRNWVPGRPTHAVVVTLMLERGCTGGIVRREVRATLCGLPRATSPLVQGAPRGRAGPAGARRGCVRWGRTTPRGRPGGAGRSSQVAA